MSLFYKELEKKPGPKDEQFSYPGSSDLKQESQFQKEENKFVKENQRQERNMFASLFLDNKDEQEGCCSKLCACTQLSYYKDYYKVTTKDVIKRILCGVKFWQGDFFVPKEQEYDFYGPFWIYTTIVFCLSATHNILRYQTQTSFEFNFQIIGLAFTVTYLLGFCFPVILTFILKCFVGDVQHIQLICLYGYASSVYGIAILLCSFNVCILHWILLGYAAISKGACIIKNVFTGFEIGTNRKFMITGFIILQAVLQFLFIKYGFIYCLNAQQKVAEHHLSGFLKYRSYSQLMGK